MELVLTQPYFCRYKYLMQFMCDNAQEAAEEIRAVYIESMGRTISALFRAYHAQLMKLELEMANRHDLIAVEVSRILDIQCVPGVCWSDVTSVVPVLHSHTNQHNFGRFI